MMTKPLGASRVALLLCLILVLTGCQELFGDGDGEALLIATDQGAVVSILGGSDQATVQWTATVSSASQVSMVDDGSAAYVGSGRAVEALALADGSSVWTVDLDDDVVQMAAPAGGRVFVMTFTSLKALSTADGSEEWTLDFLNLGGVSDSALVQAGGTLVLGGDPIRLVEMASGEVTGSYSTGDDAVSELLMSSGGSSVLAGLADGVASLSTQGLSEQWRISAPAEVDHLAISGSSLGYSVLGGGLLAVSLSSGSEQGSTDSDAVYAALAASDTHFIGARSDATLHAYESGGLAQAWTVDDVASPARALVVVGETLFYANGGFVDGINAPDGSSLWSFQPEGAAVALHAL